MTSKKETANQLTEEKTRYVKSPVVFIEELKLELKKITWPTKDVTIKSSVLTLIVMILSTLYVYGLDLIYTNLFSFLR